MSEFSANFSLIVRTLLNFSFDSIQPSNGDISEGMSDIQILDQLNNAFLLVVSGSDPNAFEFIERMTASPKLAMIEGFYRKGVERIEQELKAVAKSDADFAGDVQEAAHRISTQGKISNASDFAEKTWSVFFPEAVGIHADEEKAIESLRKKRVIRVTKLNDNPIQFPVEEVLFTSNVLLTIPPGDKDLDDLHLSPEVKTVLEKARMDEQSYWYDHPIQIGVEPEKNEALYGMRALNDAVVFEKRRKRERSEETLTCVLSVSVTHNRLREIAKQYLQEEFYRAKALSNLNLFVFTETQTQALIHEILVPASVEYLGISAGEAVDLLQVIGVDGEYGRHYSFLKAISAFWHVFVNPDVRATFKIDLDQVFPQDTLVNDTGASAFEHLCTPLWGAQGADIDGNTIDLGMIAGALVNKKDIDHSLFTPDVQLPSGELTADEFIFFSRLPQAISTQAEMLTRYHSRSLDGKKTCIQRVHVTGGTNGILVESLFRHRPFTPSFFSRAEDQAYILSVLLNQDKRLGYVHEDGLIMRHDKEALAQEAMKAAYIGKLVGDYTRIFLFSSYAKLLSGDISQTKTLIDPFTGCFVSRIPITVVYLRFALKAASFFAEGKESQGAEFIRTGSARILQTSDFISDGIGKTFVKEQKGWNLYYNTLEACRSALKKRDKFANELRERARELIQTCQINSERVNPDYCLPSKKIMPVPDTDSRFRL